MRKKSNEKRVTRFWTIADVNWLKDNYKKLGTEYCAAKLERSYAAVVRMASRLNIYNEPHYTEEEIELLRTAWMTDESTESIAKRLGRSVGSIYMQRARLGLPQRKRGNWRRKPIGKRWRL